MDKAGRGSLLMFFEVVAFLELVSDTKHQTLVIGLMFLFLLLLLELHLACVRVKSYACRYQAVQLAVGVFLVLIVQRLFGESRVRS